MTDRTIAPKALHPLVRTSLHERVAERVLSHIVQNELTVGDRIPSERKLARRFAVSRSSVRQAIVGLINASVLSSRYGGGKSTARLNLDTETFASVFARRAFLATVHEARLILEVPAAGRAATRRDDPDLEAIGRALELMASEVAAGEVGTRGDAAFHAAITAAAYNAALSDLMACIQNDVTDTRSELLSQDGRLPRSLDDHRCIAKAIAAQDPESAETAMTHHLHRVADVRLLTGGTR